MLWKSQEPHLWKRQSYPLEDAECCSQHIPMDQRDLRCTRVHSQQEHCSPRSQARQHSGKLTNANKPQTSQKSIALRVNLIFSTIDYWLLTMWLPRAWVLIFGSDFRTFPSSSVINMAYGWLQKGYRMVFASICEHASSAIIFASMSSD